METYMHVETRLRWQDPPHNQRDRKLKRLWRGVKFSLAIAEGSSDLCQKTLNGYGGGSGIRTHVGRIAPI